MRHGILLIAKPEGPTSHDIVQQARRVLHEPKIGHLGTLDPAASGLLVLFVGKKALKTIELFQDTEKEYEARILCGSISSTYDREGVIKAQPEKKGWSAPTQTELQNILRTQFTGTISQRPPAHSAVHLDGERAYDIIRKDPNAILDLPEREVTISNVQLISYGYPNICLKITCSAGTYIRSIAHDLGQLMRSGAYLEGLKRTRVGSWRLEDAIEVDEPPAWGNVLPLKEILSGFPRVDLTEETYADVQNGRSFTASISDEPTLAWYDDLPVAILERKEGKVKPRKVL
jgi:tRNA pseudouridine55 synthase